MTALQDKAEAKTLIALALPTIVAQLAQAGLGVIDTAMAGHHSTDALAAIALGTNVFNPMVVFIIGIMLAVNPMTAQLNGAKSYEKMSALTQNAMFLGLLLAIPGVFIIRNFEPMLILMFDIEPALAVLTGEYLDALSWGVPGLFLFFALRFTNEGLFANKVIMQIALFSLPLNVVLNYWFIYGGLGLEPMGVVGMGYATGAVYFYMFVALLIFTARAKRYSHIRFFEHKHRPDWLKLKEIMRIGIPMGFAIGLEVALFAVIGLMIGSYSKAEIAGHQVAISISSMCYMMPLGLSIAITARVGYHIGAKDPVMAKHAGYLGIGMSLLVMSFTALVLVNFPELLAGLYGTEIAVTAIVVQLLFFAALFQLSDGLQVASLGALRGLKDSRIPLYICGFSYWVVGFPLGIYFAEKLGWGVKGYWIAMISGLSVAAVLLTIRFVGQIRLRIEHNNPTEPVPSGNIQ